MRPITVLVLMTIALGLADGSAGPASAAGGGGGKGSAAPSASSQGFVTLPPISVPVIQRSAVYGFLQLEVVLQVDDPGLEKRVRSLFPRLKDAYLRNMNAYAANHIQPGFKPDVDSIAQTLQAITDHTLQTRDAHVLFSQIMLQKAY